MTGFHRRAWDLSKVLSAGFYVVEPYTHTLHSPPARGRRPANGKSAVRDQQPTHLFIHGNYKINVHGGLTYVQFILLYLEP